MKNNSRRHHITIAEEGFSLLETLIAITILSLVLGLTAQTVALAATKLFTSTRAKNVELLTRQLLATGVQGTNRPGIKGLRPDSTYHSNSKSFTLPDGRVVALVVLTVETDLPRTGRYQFRLLAFKKQHD